MASKNRPRIAVAGFAAARWYPDTPGNHLPLRLQRHVLDHLRCSKQSRLLRRALPILPPSPLTAIAHLQPLAQPTALRHPGSRYDIDSHPDCRPFLTLIVAPHTGSGIASVAPTRRRQRSASRHPAGSGAEHALTAACKAPPSAQMVSGYPLLNPESALRLSILTPSTR